MEKQQLIDEINCILFTIRPEANFSASDDYIADGLLDSFDIVTLVSELDSKFRISIPGDAIVPENFMTTNSIASLVNTQTDSQ